MAASRSSNLPALVVLGIIATACAPGQFFAPTVTPSATATPRPTSTPIPPTATRTPVPTRTSTRAPTRTPTPTIPPPEHGHYAGTAYNVPWISFQYDDDETITGFALTVETSAVGGTKYTCTISQPADATYTVTEGLEPGSKFFVVGSPLSGTWVEVTISASTATATYSIWDCGQGSNLIGPVAWSGKVSVSRR